MGAILHQPEKSFAKPGISRTGCLSGSGFQPTKRPCQYLGSKIGWLAPLFFIQGSSVLVQAFPLSE